MNICGPGRGRIATPRSAPLSIGLVLTVTATVAGILVANGCVRTPSGDTARPHAVPEYGCPVGNGTCQGPLTAGTYRTGSFRPAIVYSVADGWTNTVDVDSSFRLTRAQHRVLVSPSASFLAVYRNSFPEVTACPQPATADNSAVEVVNRWLSNPTIYATRPTAVHVGGLPGHMLTITRNPGASEHCARPAQFDTSPLGTRGAGGPSVSQFLPPGATKTVYLLTAGTDIIVIDVTHVPGRDTMDQYRQLTDRIVNSLAIFPSRAPDPPMTAGSA